MPATAGGESGVPEGGQPNIVVVMTDDQTLASMSVMPKVERLLAERGVEFTNSFVSNPECCPSRATYLTGQYSHNNGVLRNNSPNGGYPALDGLRTLPVWLQRADYFTAHIGKYLNQYGVFDPTEIPPGWTEWYGSVDFSTYWMYGYTLNENGTLVTYGERETEEPANYQTDVYAARAAEVIARQAPEEDPFFLSVAPLAPHPEVWPANSDIPPFPNPRPAPRHSDAFATAPLPRPPSFNERNVSDKPEAIRDLKRLNPLLIALARERHRSQLAALLAVDDMVETIVESLRSAGELSNTMIVFTSDNGVLNGEHRVTGKQLLYEESTRVPLIVRGPGVPIGEHRKALVANVDLAPTILDWAGASAEADLEPDGRSLRRLIDEPRRNPERAILFENWCQDYEPCFDPVTPRYQGARTRRYVYAEYANGERELFDLRRDPFQLKSVDGDQKYADERKELARILLRLQDCAGASCRSVPKLRLAPP